MLKFSIRELLLLTLVAAMALGWWIDRSALVSENARLATECRRVYEMTIDEFMDGIPKPGL